MNFTTISPYGCSACRVLATWAQRYVVADRGQQPPRVYLVDLDLPGCTCQRYPCQHQVAARQVRDAGRTDFLERVQPETPARLCPQCGRRALRQLRSPLLTVAVCEGCGFGWWVSPTPQHVGNGRPGRRARTAVRYL